MASIIPPAESMQKNPLQQRALKEYVADILKRLRDELKEARIAGKYDMFTTIPIQYEIPNMKNGDSQRIIFSSVIQVFIDQGYTVKIKPEKKKCTLYIRWITEEDENDIQDQIKLIVNHSSNME